MSEKKLDVNSEFWKRMRELRREADRIDAPSVAESFRTWQEELDKEAKAEKTKPDADKK